MNAAARAPADEGAPHAISTTVASRSVVTDVTDVTDVTNLYRRREPQRIRIGYIGYVGHVGYIGHIAHIGCIGYVASRSGSARPLVSSIFGSPPRQFHLWFVVIVLTFSFSEPIVSDLHVLLDLGAAPTAAPRHSTRPHSRGTDLNCPRRSRCRR